MKYNKRKQKQYQLKLYWKCHCCNDFTYYFII